MKELNGREEMQRVLAMTPQSAADWLRGVLKANASVPADFDWDALAAMIATLAVDREDAAWAELGADLYEHLAHEARSRVESERLLLSAMRLHALLISRFQAIDHARSVDRLLAWFRERLPVSIAEATERTSSWQTLPAEQILELRQIKNRLTVLAVLESAQVVDADAELASWLALRPLLP